MFLNDIGNNPNFEIGKYLDVDDYEDEYSHDEINDAMRFLTYKIRSYIHKDCPNKFIVFSSYDYCVFVMTIDHAKALRMLNDKIEENIVR